MGGKVGKVKGGGLGDGQEKEKGIKAIFWGGVEEKLGGRRR